MTLSPFTGRQVRPRPDQPSYELNEVCAHPDCGRPATDRHHALNRGAGWPRKSDYWWAELDGELLVPVSIGLCRVHHQDVTGGVGGHRAQLLWVDDEGWYWITLPDREGFMLVPQPEPVAGLLEAA